MRVVSWNMDKRVKKPGQQWTWDYLLKILKPEPDVALLQECSPIVDAAIKKTAPIEVNVNERNKNTIYCKSGGLIPYRNKYKPKLPYDGGMGFNVASKKFPGFDDDVYFISVYGNWNFWSKWRVLDIHIIGVLTIYVRTLRDLYDAKHIIIAGDFNIDPCIDPCKDNPYKRWSEHFKDLCSLAPGFTDCLKSDKSESPHDVHTFRNKRDKSLWQLDHFFATAEMYERLKWIKVITDDKDWERSDHRPIVAEFE